MLIAQTKSTNPISSFFLISFFWLINLGLSFREIYFDFPTRSDLPLVESITAHIFILATSIFLNKTLTQNKLVGVGYALSGLLFLVFVMGINEVHQYYTEFISIFLITLGNHQLIGLYNAKKNYLKEFEIGILFGLSVVISPNLFLVISMIFVGVAIVVPFTWRDFIVPLLGFFWVLVAKLFLVFLLDIWNFDLLHDLYFSVPVLKGDFDFNHTLLLLLCLFELVLFYKVCSILSKRSIRERVFYWLWIWTFIFFFLSLFLFQESFDEFILVAFLGLPCSVFSVEYFTKKGKLKGYWKKEILIYIFIIIQFSLRIY
tara:strand:+ start:980 stop:1927 length:948 start_codon:yes stop_codon:yes gene_type:complete